MPKQHAVVAVVADTKKEVERKLTDARNLFEKKSAGFDGLTRSFKKFDEKDPELTPERKLVQNRVDDVIQGMKSIFVKAFDTVLTQEVGNTQARAPVEFEFEGKTFKTPPLPVSFLLFVEHKLTDFETIIKAIPTLSLEEEWEFNENLKVFTSTPAEELRTKKIQDVLTKAQATDKFPAQVEVITRDVPSYRITIIKQSGAIPIARKNQLLARVQVMMDAVKVAKETANLTEVQNQVQGEKFFDFVFAE